MSKEFVVGQCTPLTGSAGAAREVDQLREQNAKLSAQLERANSLVPVGDEWTEQEMMFDAARHRAILCARRYFLDHGFDIEGDAAVMASGYGSGALSVDIIPLVTAILLGERGHRSARL